MRSPLEAKRSPYPLFLIILLALNLLRSCPLHAAQFSLRSVELLSGHYWSPVIGATHRQDLNYMALYMRSELIRVLKSVSLLGEITFNKTTKGPDGFMGGVTFILRKESSNLYNSVPYIQIGGGVLYNDIYKDYEQDLIGNLIEFNPQLGTGLMCELSKGLNFHVEASFQHISNAGLKKGRNIGVNGVGFLLGLSWTVH
ncbi:MAG: acyloxyacyl hydrolase [Desulfatiglandales bacterium]